LNYIDSDNAPTTVDPVPAFAVGAVAARPMTAVELLRETWRNLVATGPRAAATMLASGVAVALPALALTLYSMLTAPELGSTPSPAPPTAGADGPGIAFIAATLATLAITPLAAGFAVGTIAHLVEQRTRRLTLDSVAAFRATWRHAFSVAATAALVVAVGSVAAVVPCGLLLLPLLPFLLPAIPAAALEGSRVGAIVWSSLELGRSQYGKLFAASLAIVVPLVFAAGALAVAALVVDIATGGLRYPDSPDANTVFVLWVLLAGGIAPLAVAGYTALAVFAATTQVRRVDLIHGRTIVDPNVFS
jgi:hypothetical protein